MIIKESNDIFNFTSSKDSKGNVTYSSPAVDLHWDPKNGFVKYSNLFGTAKKDTIIGGSLDSTILGGLGADELTGAGGADIFLYKSTNDSGITKSSRDIITDFKSSEHDKINLAMDADSTIKGHQSFSNLVIGDLYSSKKTFTGAGQMFFETSTNILYCNVNKNPAADFSIKLNGVMDLSLADFIL